MEKVQLNELTEKDVENLMDNSKVWNEAIETISEQVSFALDDFLNALDGLGEYSINDSSDRYNCLFVDNSYKFLGSLEDACGYNAGVLSDKQIEKANKLVSKYENTDCNDEQWEQVEDDMDKLANEYADTLLDAMVADYDVIYDNGYVKDFMQEELEYMYDDSAFYNRDNNTINYMVQD